MSGVITTALKHLVAAGVTGEALVTAIAEIEAEFLACIPAPGQGGPVDQAAEKRRAYDRERKRRAKEAKDNSTGIPPETSGIPQNERNSTGTAEAPPALPLPPKDINSNPPAPTHPDNSSGAREAIPFDAHVTARNEALAAGWKPKRKRKTMPVAPVPDRPEEVSEQVWSDFLIHRRRIDADLTATALAGFRREADRVGWTLEQAISESILRGWRGFKAEWVQKDERSTTGWGGTAGNGRPDRRDGATKAWQRRLELGADEGPAGSAGRRDDDEPGGGRLLPAPRPATML